MFHGFRTACVTPRVDGENRLMVELGLLISGCHLLAGSGTTAAGYHAFVHVANPLTIIRATLADLRAHAAGAPRAGRNR